MDDGVAPTASGKRMIMRLIDADRMAVDELAAFISAQAKSTDAANWDVNNIVHEKIQRLIADTPTVEDAVLVVHCKDCPYFEPVWGDELLGRCTQAKAWYENRCIWDYCSNSGKTTEAAEPQLDSIQFRTVDDLGRICLPKDIRDKLGIKPGTECAVYATDELTPDEIIAIRRKRK